MRAKETVNKIKDEKKGARKKSSGESKGRPSQGGRVGMRRDESRVTDDGETLGVSGTDGPGVKGRPSPVRVLPRRRAEVGSTTPSTPPTV